jgi:TPR repeat protein
MYGKPSRRAILAALISLSCSTTSFSQLPAPDRRLPTPAAAGLPEGYLVGLRKDAAAGYTDAQNELGRRYYMGDGLRQDFSQAARLFRKTAEKDDKYGQAYLGTAYWEGKGVRQDYAEAARWFRRSAVQGFNYGQYGLGLALFQGSGISKDYFEAARWFQKAADGSYSPAWLTLGIMYREGLGGLARDWVQADLLLNLAAAAGVPTAAENRDQLEKSMPPALLTEVRERWKRGGASSPRALSGSESKPVSPSGPAPVQRPPELYRTEDANARTPSPNEAVGAAQTVFGSAWVMCSGHQYDFDSGGPIVGAIINKTNTTITDLEVELSIITRDKRGRLKRQRDTQFRVVPSLNQAGMVTTLRPNGDVYFSIPGSPQWTTQDSTCPLLAAKGDEILNVAAIAITRINGKSLLAAGKQAPLESMLQVSPYTPSHVPTQREVIDAIREQNSLLQSTIINKQLQDCVSRGTWACTFNNDTNINVVISQR